MNLRRIAAPAPRVPLLLPSLLLFSLVLAHCAIGPDYKRPTVPIPHAFKEAIQWKDASPGDESDRGDWWRDFGDPLLDSLEARVNIDNLNIQVADAQFRQARALVLASRASFYPSLSAVGGFSRGNTASSLTNVNQMAPPINSYSLGLDATWEIDVWGRVRRAVESNTAAAQASAALLAGTRLSVHATLAQYYFQLRILDTQRDLLEKTAEAYEKAVTLTTNRYESGVASKADVMQAVTQLKATRAQAIDTQLQRAQLEHAIAALLGRTPDELHLARNPVDPAKTVPPNVPPVLPSKLLERRPDIAAYERQVAAANAQIGVARAAYFPVFSISADASTKGTDRSLLFSAPTRRWSLAPGFSETLFDGGLRSAKHAQALAAYDQTVASYRQAVLTGVQETEDNLATLRILNEEARAQQEAVDAALLSLELVTNQYRAGIVAYSSVITAQTTALANQRTAINILGSRMTATILLIKALGGGWDVSQLPDSDELKK